MTRKEAIVKLKELGITGECYRKARKTEIKVTDPQGLSVVSQNIKEIKSLGFFVTLYGQCKPSNLNPSTPDEMERCDSCYLSATTYK